MSKLSTFILQLFAVASFVGSGACTLISVPEPSGRRDVLVWSLQLTRDQCPDQSYPCLNIYAVNQTYGDVLWYAYTTSSSAIKGLSLGRHSVYYTTWSGPGLYTINAVTGHVRWQFPVDNWFRYWIKDIDLPPSASFTCTEEVKELVYVTAPGPPSHLYGLRTKSGAQQWEFKSPVASAVLADLAGPQYSSITSGRTVFLAYNIPSSNSSWLQALDITTGNSIWKTDLLNGTVIDRIELHGARLLATTATADQLLAFSTSDGWQLWQRQQQYCSTPSPIADLRTDLLLLSESCDGLSELSGVDAVTGKTVWSSWDVPDDAVPSGNCTWVAEKDGNIVFGCSCSVRPRRLAAAAVGSIDSSAAKQQHDTGGSSSMARQQPGLYKSISTPADGKESSGICLYSISARSGKLHWVTTVSASSSSSNGTSSNSSGFPAGAQTWGMQPLLHQGLAIFLGSNQLMAVDDYSGKLVWVLQLQPGEQLPPWQLPVLDSVSHTLLLTPQRTNKTAVTAVVVLDGKLMWRKTVNGTAQPPKGLLAGAEQLWVSGGRVYVEACRGRTCCLRALNMTTGKQKWGMCLEAEAGEDATHPHAQFAIWIITLVTIASIGLLIVGACLLYVHRWTEERKILDMGDDSSSPRHTYRHLPDRVEMSDSDNEETERYQAAVQRASRGMVGGRAAATGAAGRRGVYVQPQQQYVRQVVPPAAPAAAAAVTAASGRFLAGVPAAAAAPADAQAIGQHQESVWVQERGAISAMARPRVPADDEPAAQLDSL